MNPMSNMEKLIKEKGFEFRQFSISNIEVRASEDGKEEMILEGVPCTFGQETVLYKGKHWELREVIEKNAFDGADMSDVIFNYNHCGRVYARTRNKSLNLEVKDDGLHMKATLMSDDEGHHQLFRDIKSGLIDKMSFAFVAEEKRREYIEQTDGPNIELCTVTKMRKIYDVSAVDIPAYDTTSISARSRFFAEREQSLVEEINERKHEVELAKAKYFYNQK